MALLSLVVPSILLVFFGILLAFGMLSLNDRTVQVPSLFVIPVILLASEILYTPVTKWWYLLGVGVGGIAGFVHAVRIPLVLRGRGRVRVPGSFDTIILLLFFFFMRGFAYTLGTIYYLFIGKLFWTEGVSIVFACGSLIVGAFLGRTIGLLRSYFKMKGT